MTAPERSEGGEAELRQALLDSRRALLRLHKALFDHERIRFEQIRGRVETSGELLQLVINDPWFEWLRPLSGLIVQMDELLEEEDAPVAQAAQALLTETRKLLSPNEQGAEFQREYYRSLQQSPEVVLAHGAWKRVTPR